MRLSAVLCFKKTVNGYIFGGKHRLVQQVKYKAMEELKQDFERQDKIMKLLRYPYLTQVRAFKLIDSGAELSCRANFDNKWRL